MASADLWAYLAKLEEEGQISHINAEADWELELGAISRKAIEMRDAALLFENIQGYPNGCRVLANPISGTRPLYGRMALAMGLPKDTSTFELIKQFAPMSLMKGGHLGVNGYAAVSEGP